MLTQINANNRIYRKYCRTKNQNTKEELYNSLKFHRHTLHKLTRLSKANHYRSYFEETWHGIREIIHISKKSSQSIKHLYVHSTISSNLNITPNTINQFLCDVPKKNESEIVPIAKKYHDYLLNTCDNSFFIQSAAEDKVERYIELLKKQKTNGLSSLSNKIFQQFKKYLKIWLATLANLTFEKWESTEILKTTKVVTIHKKGNKADWITDQFL